MKEQNSNLQQEVQGVQHQFQEFQDGQQKASYQNRQRQAYRMLHEFTNATDDKGNRLHPYIEHVANDMKFLIDNNRARNMEDAYQMAENMNPDIRAARDKQRNAARVTENKRKAEKVRNASNSGIVNKSSGKPGKPVRTTEQQVEAAYRAVNS
jgi:hypothetical protein